MAEKKVLQEHEWEHRFWVRYKPNPNYTGSWHAGLKAGIHGKRFQTIKEANDAAVACKKYFNEEAVLQKLPNKQGKVEDVVNTTIHDNVIVWIEHYVDDGNGFRQVELEPKKKEKAA